MSLGGVRIALIVLVCGGELKSSFQYSFFFIVVWRFLVYSNFEIFPRQFFLHLSLIFSGTVELTFFILEYLFGYRSVEIYKFQDLVCLHCIKEFLVVRLTMGHSSSGSSLLPLWS